MPSFMVGPRFILTVVSMLCLPASPMLISVGQNPVVSCLKQSFFLKNHNQSEVLNCNFKLFFFFKLHVLNIFNQSIHF